LCGPQAIYRFCDRAERLSKPAHHLLEGRKIQRLWSIRERAFRARVNLDNQTVGANGNRRP
jgi:hypothetical protein